MRREVERMMRLRAISILFGVLLGIVLVAMIAIVLFMNTGDYSGINPKFNKIEAMGEEKTQEYKFEEFDSVGFFSDYYAAQRTLFRQGIPSLKIVNSKDYRVEITANGELFEKLQAQVIDGTLWINFADKCYNDIERNNKLYKGLFVDCTTFDVTVYAPVSSLHTSAEIELNYEAPKAERIWVVVSGEIIDGKIFHVDSKDAVFSFNGNSNVEISGKVSNAAGITARHNSRVDASYLETKTLSTHTTAQVFGLSIIKLADGREFPLFDAGVILSVMFLVSTLAFAACFIIFRLKFSKQKEKIDRYIEEQKKLEKYLKV